jgi:hypothetical protein
MKPLILDYAINRKGEINVLYEYDFQESLNTITVNNQKKAFIDSANDDVSFLTKTKVQLESDDNDFNLLELSTITRVLKERDEDYCSLMEFQIKTLISRERDDESFTIIQ